MPPNETVYRKNHPILTLWVCSALAFSLLVGVGAYVSFLRENLASGALLVVLSLASAIGCFLITGGLPLVFGWILRRMRPYAFHEDRVVSNGFFWDEAVAYDEVAMAVRTDPLMKTSSVELVRAGTDNLTLARVADPDRVDDLLRSHLPSTAEVLDRHAGNDNALQWVLQAYTEEYAPDPNAPPILDADTFEALTGVPAGRADLDRLDDISRDTSIADLDPSDLLIRAQVGKLHFPYRDGNLRFPRPWYATSRNHL